MTKMERIATARLTTVLADVLSARPEILEAYLFGSQARGDVGDRAILTSLWTSTAPLPATTPSGTSRS